MTLSSSLNVPVLDDILSKRKGKKHAHHNTVLEDYWLALVSRELSLQGRREVLTGKAKFGVFGDGKELPQIAMAKAFRKGDYRAGYYRDQTLMMALDLARVEDFLGQLYGDVNNDPYSGGRQMIGHFATPFIDEEGQWTNQQKRYNITSGISCTAGQMGRALGLAYASKKFRALGKENHLKQFSDKGNEICFCTIGDASTSEGVFWETVNAAAVEQVPLLIAVWDDGYGISVPTELQTAKGSISRALEGFINEKESNGIDLYTVDGYDYPALCVTFDKAAKRVRKKHIPAVVHVKNLTQQQGHSTSGSHERYKSVERLQWEHEHDCIRMMEKWMKKNRLIDEEVINEMHREARSYVRERKKMAWDRFRKPQDEAFQVLKTIVADLPSELEEVKRKKISGELEELVFPTFGETLQVARRALFAMKSEEIDIPPSLISFIQRFEKQLTDSYNTHLVSKGDPSPLNASITQPVYSDTSIEVNGYQLINTYFDKAMQLHPEIYAFGEDVGHIGDVNQGMAGLQEKYGKDRVSDTGIREWTIIGQGMGMAMRGLRPIAEIQYLDYLVYAMPILTDDLATLRYRSAGQQQAPMIVRTRGHRLEGIWHTGSPLGMMVNAFRGIHICVPRNMTQAAGMYSTLLQGSDPAIVIECLNGYRLKERLPDNIGVYNVPLGMPEIVRSGEHITVVTYGSCVRYALEAAAIAEDFGISTEVVDVQTLLPFDKERIILSSLKKTNKILFLDEDVVAGGTAFMMQQVLETQGGFNYLDYAPETMCAAEHRTPYGTDGDYFAKPQTEGIAKRIYEMVFEEVLY